MKRVLTILCALFFLPSVCFAQTDQAIEFMGIPWNESAFVYITIVRQNVGLKNANPSLEDFYSVGNNTVVLQGNDDLQIEDNCGYMIDVFPYLNNDYFVAGYPVMCISAQTVYSVNNGYVNTSPISSRVVEIKYMLEDDRIANISLAGSDLVNKLSCLYGEYDHYYEREGISKDGAMYYSYRWNGAGSFVKLDYGIESDGTSSYINIIYGIDNANELIDFIRHPEKTIVSVDPDITIDPSNIDNL